MAALLSFFFFLSWPLILSLLMSSLLLLILLLSCVVVTDAQEIVWDNCDVETYYSDVIDELTSRTQLEDLLLRTHRKVLPYTDDDDDDVWKALKDIDASPNKPGYVRLIYRQVDVLANLSGDPSEGWNREHLWPKSLGVEKAGPDFSDLHHLKPSDWNVNSARSNKYFATPLSCLDVDVNNIINEDNCKIPAHVEAANDTMADSVSFLPPRVARGVIARALLYMDVRYSNQNNDGDDLQLTDCPPISDGNDNDDEDDETTSATTYMAYKSELLKWHRDYPVTPEERTRNFKACQWQGNRNPFVDYEFLAAEIFGQPSSEPPYSCNGDDIIDDNNEGILLKPTVSPGTGPNDNNDPSTCSSVLSPGDIIFVGINSDNPDTVAMVSLVDIPAANNITLYLTDKGWSNTADDFVSGNEGIIKLTTLSSNPIKAGEVFGYYGSEEGFATDEYNNWERVSGSLALSASGDTILLFCQDNNDDSAIHFVAGLSYDDGDTAWTNNEDDTGSSDLPDELKDVVVTLDHADNYMYSGQMSGTPESLRKAIINSSNWMSSNGQRFENLQEMEFDVIVDNSASSTAKTLMISGLFSILIGPLLLL